MEKLADIVRGLLLMVDTSHGDELTGLVVEEWIAWNLDADIWISNHFVNNYQDRPMSVTDQYKKWVFFIINSEESPAGRKWKTCFRLSSGIR